MKLVKTLKIRCKEAINLSNESKFSLKTNYTFSANTQIFLFENLPHECLHISDKGDHVVIHFLHRQNPAINDLAQRHRTHAENYLNRWEWRWKGNNHSLFPQCRNSGQWETRHLDKIPKSLPLKFTTSETYYPFSIQCPHLHKKCLNRIRLL